MRTRNALAIGDLALAEFLERGRALVLENLVE